MKALWQAWGDNSTYEFLVALGVAVGALAAFALVRYVAARVVEALGRRTDTPLDDSIALAIRGTKLWLLVPLAIQIGCTTLELVPRLERVIALTSLSAIALQVGLWGSFVARHWVLRRTAARGGAEGDAVMALSILGFAARVVIWAVVLLFILDQLGVDITALVAGLGIGGIAVALAVQNVLGDLLASLSIVLDRPFVVGDFIIVDDMMGTVEQVGVKTTRLRSLGGELLVFSNSDLLKSRIRNYKQMAQRRVVFTIGVTYDTPLEKLRAIPGAIREIVQAQPKTRFDRSHFKEHGDSALVFESVYYVLDPDYNLYMDIQQAINFAINERFRAEGIEFAFPTRTLHIASPEPQAVGKAVKSALTSERAVSP